MGALTRVGEHECRECGHPIDEPGWCGMHAGFDGSDLKAEQDAQLAAESIANGGPADG